MRTARLLTVCLLAHTSGRGGGWEAASICTPIFTLTHCIVGWFQPPNPLPWTEWLTHACENITFSQLRLRAVTIQWHRYWQYGNVRKFDFCIYDQYDRGKVLMEKFYLDMWQSNKPNTCTVYGSLNVRKKGVSTSQGVNDSEPSEVETNCKTMHFFSSHTVVVLGCEL